MLHLLSLHQLLITLLSNWRRHMDVLWNDRGHLIRQRKVRHMRIPTIKKKYRCQCSVLWVINGRLCFFPEIPRYHDFVPKAFSEQTREDVRTGWVPPCGALSSYCHQLFLNPRDLIWISDTKANFFSCLVTSTLLCRLKQGYIFIIFLFYPYSSKCICPLCPQRKKAERGGE